MIEKARLKPIKFSHIQNEISPLKTNGETKNENQTSKNQVSSPPSRGLVKGATVLAIGGLISKILGAFYRIPLTNILGAEGIAVYQTVFPVYCILLTFSSTGLPSAIAKLIASGYGEKIVFKKALSVFLPISFLGSFIMIFLSVKLSTLQGNPSATLGYIFLAPSVVAVSFISCVRGYFQGKLNMTPTAISQITEQAVKLLVGLFLCSQIKGSPALLGGLACLAVTISEIACLIYLAIAYKRDTNYRLSTYILPFKRLIGTLLPIVLSTLLLPIARAFDSFTVVNVLKTYTKDAFSLYGIYTGSVESVSGVIVAVCYGIAVAVLPNISKCLSMDSKSGIKENFIKSISLTLFVSTFSGLGLFIFSPIITRVLFNTLSPNLALITSSLLSASFFTVIGLSLTQTLNSCLVAMGKPYAPCIFLSIGLAVKFLLQIYLLKIPRINVFACLYSDIACYFVAVFLNLLYISVVLYK